MPPTYRLFDAAFYPVTAGGLAADLFLFDVLVAADVLTVEVIFRLPTRKLFG